MCSEAADIGIPRLPYVSDDATNRALDLSNLWNQQHETSNSGIRRVYDFQTRLLDNHNYYQQPPAGLRCKSIFKHVF